MSTGSQAMFVVEYPCDQFCRIEVDVSRERGQVTLQQLRDTAEASHKRVHEPEEQAEPEPAADQGTSGRPAATVFLSAPGNASGNAPGSASGRQGHRRR